MALHSVWLYLHSCAGRWALACLHLLPSQKREGHGRGRGTLSAVGSNTREHEYSCGVCIGPACEVRLPVSTCSVGGTSGSPQPMYPSIAPP
jgi:hypothetical protein